MVTWGIRLMQTQSSALVWSPEMNRTKAYVLASTMLISTLCTLWALLAESSWLHFFSILNLLTINVILLLAPSAQPLTTEGISPL
jgi:hypothetical protein